MRINSVSIILLLCINFACATDLYPFTSKVKQQRFNHLLTELRCLVCQNQNLADSNAELAIDLRNKIYNFMIQGYSDNEIKTYLQQRYGNFILLMPPFNYKTLLLWSAPALMLLIGMIYFLVTGKPRRCNANF